MRTELRQFAVKIVRRSNWIWLYAIWLETVFHLCIVGKIDFGTFLLCTAKALCAGTIIGIICSFFNKKVNRALAIVLTGTLGIYYCVQAVYFEVFGTYMSFSLASGVGFTFLQYKDMVINGILGQMLLICLSLIPLAMLIFLWFKITDFSRKGGNTKLCLAYGAVFFYIAFSVILSFGGKGKYSPYDLYYNRFDQSATVESLGIITYLEKDAAQMFTTATGIDIFAHMGDEDAPVGPYIRDEMPTPSVTPSPEANEEEPERVENLTPTPTPIDRSPNVLDIDFANIDNTTASDTNPPLNSSDSRNDLSLRNNAIKFVNDYITASLPSNKNEYTGIFEGYNLIFITAEAWSPAAVSEELTPTLYKMLHSGFEFNNFHKYSWYASTISGEFENLTGMIPVGAFPSRDTVAISKGNTGGNLRANNNSLPYTLGNFFDNLGYKTYAYHNHSYTYYMRDEILSCFGFNTYRGMRGARIDGVKVPGYGLERLGFKLYASVNYGVDIDEMWPTLFTESSNRLYIKKPANDTELFTKIFNEYLNECQRMMYFKSSDRKAFDAGNKAELTLTWPESDELMAKYTINEYLDEWKETGNPFVAYYMSVSGHAGYSFGGNAMSYYHKPDVSEFDYSTTLKAYIAANYELELMVNHLIEELDKAGALSKTVFVIAPDHDPYGLQSTETLPEGVTDTYYYYKEAYKTDVSNVIDISESCLVIWNPDMTEHIPVDKTCCAMDIVPTIYNLFGAEFDSRLLMGRDILSDSPGLAVLRDGRIVTDEFEYSPGKNGYTKSLTDEPVDKDYLNYLINHVDDMFKAIEYIIKYDYFRTIEEYLK